MDVTGAGRAVAEEGETDGRPAEAALWLAALYFQGWVPGILGLVWCFGRILYAFMYAGEKKRFPGFALTIFPTLILVILAIIGIVKAWMAANA